MRGGARQTMSLASWTLLSHEYPRVLLPILHLSCKLNPV